MSQIECCANRPQICDHAFCMKAGGVAGSLGEHTMPLPQHMNIAYKMIGEASPDPDTGVDSLYILRADWLDKEGTYISEPMGFKVACKKAEIMALGGAGSYDPRASLFKTIVIERVRDGVVVWDSSPNRYVGWARTSRLLNGVK